MNFRIYRLAWILFILSLSLSPAETAFARTECKVLERDGGAWMCACKAQLVVFCGGNLGNIPNSEQPTSIRVAVFNKTTGNMEEKVLKNMPPLGIWEIKKRLLTDASLRKSLVDAGVTLEGTTEVDLVAASFEKTPTLYTDEDMTKVREPELKPPRARPEEWNCFYNAPPVIMKMKECTPKILCTGQATCLDYNRDGTLVPLGTVNVACEGSRVSTCPSASECAAQKSNFATGFSSLKDVVVDDFEEATRAKVKERRSAD